MSKEKLVLVDGNSVAFRAFFAMHNVLDKFVNSEGLHTNAVYAFNNMLESILKSEKPTHMLVAFDAGKTTFRTEMFDDYKSNRSKTPGEFTEQMPYIKELLTARGIKNYELPNYEADDIIGTLSRVAQKANYETVIVTGDRDLTQLTTDKVSVAVTVKGVSEIEKYTPEHVKEKLGISPEQIIDIKGLMGDTSDNYPGVEKVGEKTALKLIDKYGSIEELYKHVDEMKPSKLKEHLINDKDKAFLSKQLATINIDAPIEISLDDVIYEGDQNEELIKFYRDMNFKSFLSRIDMADQGVDSTEIEYKELTSDNLTDVLNNKDVRYFHIEVFGDNYHLDPVVSVGLATKKEAYVTDDVSIITIPEFKQWLENENVEKNVFDLKKTIVVLKKYGIEFSGATFDTLLAAYLLDKSDNQTDFGIIAQNCERYYVQSEEEFYGKGVKRALPTDVTEILKFNAAKLKAIADLKSEFLKTLKDNSQDSLFDEIEIPLANVLAQMEAQGITVNAQTLLQMQAELGKRLEDIEKEIFEEAGEEFNINSPKQLGVVLFEHMGLKPIKKTKTGYSTSVEILEQLEHESPVARDVLRYRQISKIQSTYVTGLLKVIQPDNKVHTRYVQTLTQTGRLSSIDPNLQNIPIRIDEGKKIRKAFLPQKEGWEIFSSDYSQVELRVLAHISGDENMQQAFKDNYDIHAHTAMNIFGLDSVDDVTPDMRRKAKATNFGIVYGISDYGLAKNIGITRKEASEFIAAYFAQYPGVKNYMDDMIKFAQENGYVETLMHRRRNLPDIHAKNFSVRSFAERTAMNTPIQGSAADIIKVAMINMQKVLEKTGLQTKMLLQVHDELIFEAPKEEIEILEELVPKTMDSAIKLDVPLKVETSHGLTWYDAK
ncbi:DNA polymerase [Companilactobacillus sp. RD055328]|uniref:DNA polymerase I n=1 Tax=Companilactobacillus sp. RD055328 TaxID=2916634 RepID=UPI001FC8116E|nr:DNA polymerase I [Companilactobacillus sp. RD055328]GKQ42500.1 DNA polymerase [Companilactobacillus sp. RD055328]